MSATNGTNPATDQKSSKPSFGTKPSHYRGSDARPSGKRKRNYLLKPEYRTFALPDINSMSDLALESYLERIRWGRFGEGLQACPKCGCLDSHYHSPSIGGWKCKGCAKQFTVFSGTRLHAMKDFNKKNVRVSKARSLMSMAFHFIEAKDGISSRELSGLHNYNHQTVHVLTLKIRETLRETMSAEPPLKGYVQADAAYFIKYVRPSNAGLGAAMAAKAEQKNAGMDPIDDKNGTPKKQSSRVNPNMHALVVFVQAGQHTQRRYRVAMIKTENQVDLLTLGIKFCDKDAIMVTDQHGAYGRYSIEFQEHLRVNHNTEFMTEDGVHTNLAENVFSRVRTAIQGAWHRMSVQNLEEYGWEIAWRLEMVGRDNKHQLDDLLRRLLTSGRPTRFIDYWKKSPDLHPQQVAERGVLKAVPKSNVSKKRGRPSTSGGKMKSVTEIFTKTGDISKAKV